MNRQERIRRYQMMDARGAMGLKDRWKYMCLYFRRALWLILPTIAAMAVLRGYSPWQAVLATLIVAMFSVAVIFIMAAASQIVNATLMPRWLSTIVMLVWAALAIGFTCLAVVLLGHAIGIFV